MQVEMRLVFDLRGICGKAVAQKLCYRFANAYNLSHSDHFRVVGRADMHPPFKRIYPGSTPGRPTKLCPCDAIGRRSPLKPGLLQVRLLSGVLAEIEQRLRLNGLISRSSVGNSLRRRFANDSYLRYQMLVWLNGRAIAL